MTDTSTGPARGGSTEPVRDPDTAPDRPVQPEDLPGIRWIVAGVVIAVLAPLFGFLVGSMIGTGADHEGPLPAVYVWLVGGIAVGAVGALIAIIGGLRLVRRRHDRAGRSARRVER